MFIEKLAGFKDILYNPPIKPEDWCDNQPCVEIWGYVISQPLSSVLVYLTAIITLIVAVYFLRSRKCEKSRFYMGAAFLLVGIGAALAGTSYQAFGYEIKCRAREFCSWTSWWEIAYMITTVIGVSALYVGVAYVLSPEKSRRTVKIYAFISNVGYLAIVVVGIIIPVRFLISFELMLIFVSPVYFAIFYTSLRSYLKNHRNQEYIVSKKLVIAALLLFVAIGGYYMYSVLGITEVLWERGIWFSENDVLHILMIVWVLYVYKALGPLVRDNVFIEGRK